MAASARREALLTRALRTLAGSSALGRTAAVRLEVLRSTGPRAARARLRQESRLRALGEEGHGSKLYRAIWEEAAAEVGAELEPLGGDFLRLSRAGVTTTVCGQAVMLDDAVTLRVADHKQLAHRLLTQAGISVPEQTTFAAADPTPAIPFVERHDGACVVKPAANSGGGAGTTGSIHSREDLLRAALKGSRWSDRLLLERQAPGLVYRVLLVDGDLLDVVRRRPPRLVGDGRLTVMQLVERENDQRLAERSVVGSLLRVDLDAVLTLREQGLSPTSVPGAGESVHVKSATSQNARRDNETYRGPLADELVDEARAAANAVGVRLAGVDVVTPDPSRALADVGGAIIEVNGEPGLQHHYEVADRDRATRVAVPLLEHLLRNSSSAGLRPT